MRRAPVLALLLCCGCPPTPPPPPSTETPPPATDGVAPVGSKAPVDPLAGSIFTKEQVLEVFEAEHRAGLPDAGPAAQAEMKRLLLKHRLVDASGARDGPRQDAYDRALSALASVDDGKPWSAYIATLPER